MPTENVLNRNFEELFKGTVRYEIPFFQRGYAWETRQWKKLFEDIYTEVLDNVTDNNFDEEEHFFGPIVVLEKINSDPNQKRFLVIDGQQRITTVYLLLAVIKRLIEAKAHLSEEAKRYTIELDTFLSNNTSSADDYQKIKVYSTKGDRLPTFKAVFNRNPRSPFLSNDQFLYNSETNKIDAFVKFANRQLKGLDIPDLYRFYKAVLKSLKIVWIPLDEDSDDPQAIFESLNDAGMPLSAPELLCNYIFKPLANDTTNEHERLHNEKWLAAMSEVGEDNFEDYLRNLFSIGEKKRVGKDRRMYVHFKVKNKRLSAETATKQLEKILDYTNVYNQAADPIKHPHANVNITGLLIKIHNTNMSSINPFLMSLLKSLETGLITVVDTTSLLNEVYVLLVRRKITALQVTKYDTFFPSLLEKVINEPNKVKAFQTEVQKEGLWVPDQVFEDSFLTREIYNLRELNFSRLVLQEIDRSMQNHGEFPDYTTIDTIEHILPQTLNEHWKIYLNNDANDISLPTVINTIGNLCLNSRPANSSFGQMPFEEKQIAYTPVSALARDVKSRKVIWNIKAIKDRSADIAKNALNVWKWN
jgi:uncharacterized protein with ParB-like and HNH nuclease domain